MPITGVIGTGRGGTLTEDQNQNKEACERRGGKWIKGASGSYSCVFPGAIAPPDPYRPVGSPEPEPTALTTEELLNLPEVKGSKTGKVHNIRGGASSSTNIPGSIVQNTETGKPIGFINSEGQFTHANKVDIKNLIRKQQEESALLEGQITTEQIGQAQQTQQEAELLSGQIGQFGELGVSPTGLDVGEAATAGVVGAIPRALGYAATGAAVGAAGGTIAGPVGTAGGAAIGAAAGFVAGMASSMLSNFKSQRTDTTTAQQRVLDEGKQNLNDWATLAATDPSNRALYVSNFNQQLALINQAYRQMKLDTSRDVAKFETALPNLAEFETFYSAQGERDFLVARMQEALLTPQDQEYIYRFMELSERRKNG